MAYYSHLVKMTRNKISVFQFLFLHTGHGKFLYLHTGLSAVAEKDTQTLLFPFRSHKMIHPHLPVIQKKNGETE